MLMHRVLSALLALLTFPILALPAFADTDVSDDGTFVSGRHDEDRGVQVSRHRNGSMRIPDWVPPGRTSKNTKLSKEQLSAMMALCWQQFRDSGCRPQDPNDPHDLTLIAGPALQAIAIRLAVQLRLPTPTPQFGPDPKKNEWKMLAVGFPVWLWTPGARTLTARTSIEGVTFTLVARLRSTTFAMGDGQGVTCTTMAPYTASVEPGTGSPACGYVYTKPSLPKGSYRVDARADWEVAWSVAGFSGVLPVSRSASASIPIGELQALNR